MMKNSTDSSNAECGWLAVVIPNTKPLSENEPENQQRWKQMPKDSNHSTNTYTATRKEKVVTTTSTDDSSKRKKLPPIAKSNMYKTKMCRNYMETGRCKYGRVCQFAHGMKELRKYSLCVCWNDSYIASSHAVSYWKQLMREMGNSQLFCWQEWPPSQRMRTYR